MRRLFRLLGMLGLLLFFAGLFFVWKTHADTATISVTASTQPQASDYSVSLSSNGASTIHQNTTTTYTITYGALSSSSITTPITLVANYAQDTVNGIDVLSYVTNSATNGYNNTVPIVDLVNKTITWSITALPPGTVNQTVTFQLETNQNYTGSNAVNFTITAEMSNQYVIMPLQSVSQTYTYQNIAPTPTPTTQPAPTATPIIALSPTPSLGRINFLSVTVSEVTSQTVVLTVITTTLDTLVAKYGTSPTNLKYSAATTSFAVDQLLQITNLNPHTLYYVQLYATDANGQTQTSDLYQFTTALSAQLPQINPRSIVILSNNIPLYVPNSAGTGTQTPSIVLPTEYPFSFRLELSPYQTITSVLAIFNPTATNQSAAMTMEARETENGIFLGGFQTPPVPGKYAITLHISDTSGAITLLPLADVFVSQPLTILDTNHQPIEDAQITLMYKDFNKNSYLPLPQQIFSLPDTLYTDITGQVRFPLPIGAYKVTVTAIGYARQLLYFSLGIKPGQFFPTIVLKKEPFNIATTALFYWTILKDTLQSYQNYLRHIANSHRFLSLNAVIATAFLVVLTFLSFIARIRIPFLSIYHYFLHIHKQLFLGDAQQASVRGIIKEIDTQTLIAGADIYLLEGTSQKIIGHTVSDVQGKFFFTRLPFSFLITVMKETYEPTTLAHTLLQRKNNEENIIYLSKQLPHETMKQRLQFAGETILGMIFETLLVLSFVAELTLGFVLGFANTDLFLFFSMMNLFLWIVHVNHTRSQENIF